MQNRELIILLSPVYTCLFFAILFLTANSEKRSPKAIIGLFMVFAFLLNLCTFLYQNGNVLLASYFNGIFMATMLSLLPLFYLYILSLTNENFSLIKNLYHLIPSLLFLLVVTGLHMLLFDKEKLYYMTKYLMGDFSDNKTMELIYVFNRSKGYVFFVQMIIYFVLSTKNLSRHIKAINNMFTKPEGLQLNWLRIFKFIYFLASVNAVTINFLPTKDVYSNAFILNISSILFAMFYFSFGLLALRQKSVMQIIRELDSSLESPKEQTGNPNELFVMINSYISKNEIYLNPELKIWDIANAVYSNRTYVSNSINEKTGMSFTNYINSFRIKKACEYLSTPGNNYLIEELASLCGFNSLSAFNRAFRLHTGVTPSKYKKTGLISKSLIAFNPSFTSKLS